MQTKSYAMLMAVMEREAWTDHRFDELDKKVDKGFERVDGDIRELRGDIKDLVREMNARFDSQNRMLIGGFFVLIAALIGSNAF